MIPIVSTAQMRSIDAQVIGGNVITGFSYMLRAGMGIFDAIEKMALTPNTDEIAIVCGKGNNGGDGYVVGRMLLDKGYHVMCYSVGASESLGGEARIAFNEYIEKEGSYFHIDDTAVLEGFGRFSLIVDALLGTGTQGDPRGLYAQVIRLINLSQKPVISVDTPSGLNNDTGVAGNPTVSARWTVTMGFPKIGQIFYPARKYIGKLIVKDLGYPREIVDQHISGVYLPAFNDLKQMVPPRKPGGSKFDHGLVFMLCGSRGMLGSVSLAAMSALRTGCGMAHCAVPHSAIPIVSVKVTEPVLYAIDETAEGTPASTGFDSLMERASSMQVALIGSGISHHPDTSLLVRKLLSAMTIPVVLDADGINAFKDHAEELRNHKNRLIITPHRREWERLFGDVPGNPADLIARLSQKAKEFAMTIVYKGSPTIIADSRGTSYILPVGNSGMATAGSGDVLSGIIASLIAQGSTPLDASILGVSIHGLAGEMASEAMGEYSVIASDLVAYISGVLNTLSPPKPAGMMF